MLGELYKPKGLALETAKAVLEVEDPWACNIALGCTNGCAYCYVPRFLHKSHESVRVPRLPKESPTKLIEKQLRKWKGALPEGVFLSFLTDPFLSQNHENTENLIALLRSQSIRVATLSKLGVSEDKHVRSGVTLVSFEQDYWRKFEPNALPPEERFNLLRKSDYKWISMEPYPPSGVYNQNMYSFLEKLKPMYVNDLLVLIVFGKLNYNPKANTIKAKEEYAYLIRTLRRWCETHHIRLHVKSDTCKFVGVIPDATGLSKPEEAGS